MRKELQKIEVAYTSNIVATGIISQELDLPQLIDVVNFNA